MIAPYRGGELDPMRPPRADGETCRAGCVRRSGHSGACAVGSGNASAEEYA